VLTVEKAVRVRDVIRRIELKYELEIISGKTARDHHVFESYRLTQKMSQIMQ